MGDTRTIAELLARRIETLTVELVGSAPTTKGRAEWRFYSKGGLVVTIAGAKRGIWCHHGASGIGGDALDLVKHFRKCETPEALEWARTWLGIAAAAPLPPRREQPPAPERPRSTVHLARRLWAESVAAEHTVVARYLAGRGVHVPPGDVIRFHPECPRGAERWPAMVALMTHPITAEAVGVHRAFLLPDGSGKAPETTAGKAKMMAGNAGVIRLSPDDDVTLGLGIAEGIETALAIMQGEWAPVWACGSAPAISKFPVLAGIEHLTVFPDMDDSGTGLDAARACGARWTAAGREVELRKPPAGSDWNDHALELAA